MKEVVVMEGNGITLFGTRISYPEIGKMTDVPVVSTATAVEEFRDDERGGSDHDHALDTEEKACLEEERVNREDSEKDQLRENKQENDSSQIAESDSNPKSPIDETNSQAKTLKKPDRILPCPRCNSMDTKFCYYNNYNVNQPRHFCKSCQRYWTAGGNMRNMPVGAGRRKNKNPISHCRFVTVSQEAFQAAQMEVRGVPPTVLSFGSDSPHIDKARLSAVSCRGREIPDDCSSGSTVTTSNSVAENTQDRNGFHSQVPCIPGVSWPYNPWNSAIPIPALCPPGYSSLPIYPSPYWNYIPWLPPSSPVQNKKAQPSSDSNSFILGKHSRDRELIKPNAREEPKKQKNENTVLTPKILRIDDPEEAAKSSIWTTLGIKNENIGRGGIFKAFQTKGEENKNHLAGSTSPVLQTNPAALSRSLCFHERA